MRFDKSALYDEDFAACTCGFFQFLGFRYRISKAIDPGT
jgi:SWIM zinc finger